jgi:phage shock protein E
MKIILSISALLIGLSTFSCSSQTNNPALEPKSFSEDFKKDDGLLLDVRTPEEYTEGHLKGAVLINYRDNSFAEQVSKLDKNKPVYVYCHSGKRSGGAQDMMLKQGFKKVINLKGGIVAWQESGMAVEK